MNEGSRRASSVSGAAPPTALDRWGVSLRPETAADASALRNLYGDLRADELAQVPWPTAQKAAFLDDQFRLQHQHFSTCHPGADYWIMVRATDGEVLGRLYLDRSGAIWRIIDIGLAAALRGQGLGGALIQWVQEEADRNGAQGVDLHVAHPNIRAKALYDRLGFKPTGEPLPTHQRMAWFS